MDLDCRPVASTHSAGSDDPTIDPSLLKPKGSAKPRGSGMVHLARDMLAASPKRERTVNPLL